MQNKKEKRILITEVSSDCRYLREIEDDCEWASSGLYCAADTRVGWERIGHNTCENCTRGKCLTGEGRRDLIERGAKALGRKNDPEKISEGEYEKIWQEEIIEGVKNTYRRAATIVLDAMLGKQ